MSRLAEKLDSGEIAVGSMDTLGSARLLEVMGFAGLDIALIDLMFCPTDWETVAEMVRAARNFQMDTIVRVPGFPWLDRTDPGLAVSAVRALGVGATGVMASCSTVEEVAQLIEVSKDWHRDIHLHAFGDDEFARHSQDAADAMVMPLIESQGAIKHIGEIVALPGLRVISLGMTDVSRMLGHPFEYEHPEVSRFVDEVIATADQQGVAVGGNVGYEYSRSIDETAARVTRMVKQGFKFIWLQNNGFVIQWMYRRLLEALRPVAPASGPNRGGE